MLKKGVIKNNSSLIQYFLLNKNNHFYIKREDLIPFSFGGNKARKADLFFQEIDQGGYDCVVTYGSSSSNHCRVVSNMAVGRKVACYIIAPAEASEPTFNSQMMDLFGAEITTVPVELVHDTIEEKMSELKNQGMKPYFIPGGGHGNIGTQAYVNCYNEIKEYEKGNDIYFDYIFHASGTGTTQAGLICGQLMCGDKRRIVGISIARKNPRGRQVVIDSVKEYLSAKDFQMEADKVKNATVFDDSYVGEGYGKSNSKEVIDEILKKYGIPLDETYTGKAFYGMQKYISKHKITGKNILFIHTGGTPLFFDYLRNR